MTTSSAHPADPDIDLAGATDLDAEIAASGVPLRLFVDPDDGSRVAVFAPVGARVTSIDHARALREVQVVAQQLVQLRDRLDRGVAAARDAGLSWSAIGFSTGMTGEGARQRWSDDV